MYHHLVLGEKLDQKYQKNGQNWANPPKNSKIVKKLSQYYNGFSDFSDEMYGEYIVFPIF